MTRRNFNWVQGIGLVGTVFAMSALVITAGLQWTSVPAYATERGEERRDDRGDRRDDRGDARDTRQEGREAAREQRKNARKQTIKVIGNVGRKSEIPRTMHARCQGHKAKLITIVEPLTWGVGFKCSALHPGRASWSQISSSPFAPFATSCYQDRTNQTHLSPLREYPGLWFLVDLGCLR